MLNMTFEKKKNIPRTFKFQKGKRLSKNFKDLCGYAMLITSYICAIHYCLWNRKQNKNKK